MQTKSTVFLRLVKQMTCLGLLGLTLVACNNDNLDDDDSDSKVVAHSCTPLTPTAYASCATTVMNGLPFALSASDAVTLTTCEGVLSGVIAPGEQNSTNAALLSSQFQETQTKIASQCPTTN